MSPGRTANPDPERTDRVVVIGEAIIDVVVSGGHSVDKPGGSPANVAVGVARLGTEVGLLTHIASDARGELIAGHLERSGVTLLPGSLSARKTSTAIATIDERGDSVYEFDVEWALDEPPARLDARVVHTGSLATFLRPGADTVRALLARSSDHAVLTYDPNVRPDVLGSWVEALDAFRATAALCDVVKLSDQDADWLFPGLPTSTVIAEILGLGPKLAIVTRGAAGSLLSTRGIDVEVPAFAVDVVDSIGAGDSYMAAVVDSVRRIDLHDLTFDQLVALGRRASIAAAINVQRSGAEPPTLAELDRFQVAG